MALRRRSFKLRGFHQKRVKSFSAWVLAFGLRVTAVLGVGNAKSTTIPNSIGL
jgi:hypothetical protein